MLDKKNWYSIFSGIGDAFEEYWEIQNQHLPKTEFYTDRINADKLKRWECLCEWIDSYIELIMSEIPKTRRRCLIETKQEYKDFTLDEVIHVIDTLASMAHTLYKRGHNLFYYSYPVHDQISPLHKYYTRSLEQVVWMVASFVNNDKGYCNFMDLTDWLKESKAVK